MGTKASKNITPYLIKNKLRGLLYLRNVSCFYRDWIRSEKNVAGFYCYATSLLRTGYTIERLKEFIEREQLPLIIEEKLNAIKLIIIKGK
jgi:hypothetical protein